MAAAPLATADAPWNSVTQFETKPQTPNQHHPAQGMHDLRDAAQQLVRELRTGQR
jgi:hypothetical protein